MLSGRSGRLGGAGAGEPSSALGAAVVVQLARELGHGEPLDHATTQGGHRALLVQHAWAEAGVDEREVAGELLEELRLMAAWLELDRIEVTGRGDLGPTLLRAVRRR